MRNFQGSIFYVNKNVQEDFQIYISVPLILTHLFRFC